MVNQNVELETSLFEELSDADLMTVVGGTGSPTEFGEKTYNNVTTTVAKIGDVQGDARDQLLNDVGNLLFGH